MLLESSSISNVENHGDASTYYCFFYVLHTLLRVWFCEHVCVLGGGGGEAYQIKRPSLNVIEYVHAVDQRYWCWSGERRLLII